MPEVAGVLEIDGDEDERDAGEEFVHRPDGWEHEGRYALGRAGIHEAVEDVTGEPEDLNRRGNVGRDGERVGQEDGFEQHTAAQGLFNEVMSLQGR